LTTEVNNIFNHPLKEIVLLRAYDQTTFNKIIDQLCKNFSQSAELRTIFDIIYTRGIGELRKEITSKSSKRTWFRKKQKIKQLLKEIDLPPPQDNIDNAKVIEYLLSQFGIEPNIREPKQLEIFS
jgi:ketol-acid reductoisomerase